MYKDTEKIDHEEELRKLKENLKSTHEWFLNNKKLIVGNETNIFLVGTTGSGKSTLICYLNGEALKETVNKKGNRVIEDTGRKIGHGFESKTIIPNMEGCLIDCGGILDTRGPSMEIAIQSLIYTMLDQSKSFSFIFVLSEADAKSSRGNIVQSIKKYAIDLFGSKEALEQNKNSFILIITKVSPDQVDLVFSEIDDNEFRGWFDDRYFGYDPLKPENRNELWTTIKRMAPLSSRNIKSNTSLSVTELDYLRKISDSSNSQIKAHLRGFLNSELEHSLAEISKVIDQFMMINCLKNDQVPRIIKNFWDDFIRNIMLIYNTDLASKNESEKINFAVKLKEGLDHLNSKLDAELMKEILQELTTFINKIVKDEENKRKTQEEIDKSRQKIEELLEHQRRFQEEQRILEENYRRTVSQLESQREEMERRILESEVESIESQNRLSELQNNLSELNLKHSKDLKELFEKFNDQEQKYQREREIFQSERRIEEERREEERKRYEEERMLDRIRFEEEMNAQEMRRKEEIRALEEKKRKEEEARQEEIRRYEEARRSADKAREEELKKIDEERRLQFEKRMEEQRKFEADRLQEYENRQRDLRNAEEQRRREYEARERERDEIRRQL